MNKMAVFVDKTKGIIDYSKYEVVKGLSLEDSSRLIVEDENGQKWFLKVQEDVNSLEYLNDFLTARIAPVFGVNVPVVDLGTFEGKRCSVIQLFDEEVTTLKDLVYVRGEVSNPIDLMLNFSDDFRLASSGARYTSWIWRLLFTDLLFGNPYRGLDTIIFSKVGRRYKHIPISYTFNLGRHPNFMDMEYFKGIDNYLIPLFRYGTEDLTKNNDMTRMYLPLYARYKDSSPFVIEWKAFKRKFKSLSDDGLKVEVIMFYEGNLGSSERQKRKVEDYITEVFDSVSYMFWEMDRVFS